MDPAAQLIVDGTLLLCWSWKDHPELGLSVLIGEVGWAGDGWVVLGGGVGSVVIVEVQPCG